MAIGKGGSAAARSSRGRRLAVALAAALLLAGCAGKRTQLAAEDDAAALVLPYDEPADPLEPVNRVLFDVNLFLDALLIRPAAEMYGFFVPPEVRDGIRNALRNASAPVILVNDLLQGEMGRAGDTVARFLVNTTIGLGGVLDFAAERGYPYHDEDFGQTLAVYGLGEGVYLVLPLLGPSSLRDVAGKVADSYLDPWDYLADGHEAEEAMWARRVVGGVDLRQRNIDTLEELRRGSIDFYARVRNVYRQRRANEVSNGEPGGLPAPGLL